MDNCHSLSHWLVVLLLGCTDPTIEAEPVPIAEPDKYNLLALPEAAQPYAHLFEDNKNPSRDMSQMWVEARGNPYAVSPLGGQGLFQFTPGTVETAEKSYCKHLGKGDPFNPYWAEPCFEAMMQWQDIEPFADYCPNREIDECRFNGGFWCVWEIRAAPELTLRSAYDICGKQVLPNGRMRSQKSCDENYAYSAHIDNFQPLFAEMGGQLCYKQ